MADSHIIFRFLNASLSLVLLLGACAPTPEQAPPTETLTPTATQAPPTLPAQDDGEEPAGPGLTEPPPAVLQIDGDRQLAAVGTYCWPGGPGEPGLCVDKIGLPTPQEPLDAPSRFSAVFQLPLETPPANLVLSVQPVTLADQMDESAGGFRWWPPEPVEGLSLSLEKSAQTDLTLDPGLYVLNLFVAWEGIGDVAYGFLIEIPSEPVGGLPALPAEVGAVVTVPDTVDFYAGPGEGYGVVKTVYGGLIWPVTGVSEDGAWWRLRCLDDQGAPLPECWVSADPAMTVPAEEGRSQVPAVAASVPYVEILAQAGLNLRTAPRLDSDILAELQPGELHEVTGVSENGAWWRLRCLNGSVGDCWISADLGFSRPTPVTSLPLEGLVYRSVEDNRLSSIGADGTSAELADAGAGLVVLSPEGTEALRCCTRGESDLWRVDLVTGEAVQLTDSPARYDFNPQWWPANEDQVLFLSRTFDPARGPGSPGPAHLAVAALDGSGDRVLDDQGLVYTPPAGDPGGDIIAYDRGEEAAAQDGILEPWLFDLEEGPAALDFEAYGLRPVPDLSFGSPSWSPEGGLLAWVVAGDLAETGVAEVALAVFDLEAKTVRVRNHYPPGDVLYVWGPPPPRWSPDSNWIAWQGSPEGSLPGFWVLRIDGEDGFFIERGDSPVWSPDGRSLAFNKGGRAFIMESGVWEQQLVGLPEGTVVVDWLEIINP